MENYSYIRYRNGFLFFTKQISETEEEITMKDFDPYVMEDIFDSLRPILRELKNEINPYLLELKRGVIAATGQACTFGSSRACKCYYENVLKFRNGNVGIIAFL